MIYLILAENWNLSTKRGQFLLLNQHSQPIYDVMQKEFENFEFVQSENYEIEDWLRNNGTKYLLIFDNSYQMVCKSKAFVDFATARRHRGSSTFYIKHNLFDQSKLGRDVEVQDTRIGLSIYARDVMRVSTLSAQLGLGSEQVAWFEYAALVPYGLLLTDLSPRTDHRLRYCKNTGCTPSNFSVPERLKHSKSVDDKHTKSPISKFSNHFPTSAKVFPFSLVQKSLSGFSTNVK